MKKQIISLVASSADKAAVSSSRQASLFHMYQPKAPKSLAKKK